MTCRILLGNPGSLFPGDSVYGRVVVDFNSKETFRAIRCRIIGEEHTAWRETENYYDRSSKSTKTRTINYIGDNKILHAILDLVGAGSLQAGHYEYPFSFTLPRMNIPGSYYGTYGYIRYHINANVDKAFAFDYKDEITLSMIAPINFNDIRYELQLVPVGFRDEKRLCCMCCHSGPITMEVVLEKEAFVVGEVAKIKVDVSNLSNESITQLNLKLKMITESKTTHPRTHCKYDTKVVASLTDTGVGAHGQRIYNIDFVIPPETVLPNFQGSTLFKQWCILKVKAVIPGFHKNLEIVTVVKLGHIPILSDSSVGPTYFPANQQPAGAFPSVPANINPPPVPSNVNPPPYSPNENVPQYQSLDKAPRYSIDPPSFPVSNANDMDFVDGTKATRLASKGMPLPASVHGGPSAPSAAKMDEAEGFDRVNDKENDKPPSPAYMNINDTGAGLQTDDLQFTK